MDTKAKYTFWKPGDDLPAFKINEEKANEEKYIIYNPNISLSIKEQRQKLPVFMYRDHILYMIEKYQTVIIVGETGSGKSTQIPQYLLENGWTQDNKMICITQPRRVAAVTLARRIAEERCTDLGKEVGYAVRFDDCWNKETTKIKFVTDGMLIKEMMIDPLLNQYSIIMLDEAHERSLHTDMAMGLLKKIQKKRFDLKIIVSSATIDADEFLRFFQDDNLENSEGSVSALTVEGRMFPVEISNTIDYQPDYIKSTIETILKIHRLEDDGDILAFLTGQEEVELVARQLKELNNYQDNIHSSSQLAIKKNRYLKLIIIPLYAGLPFRDQLKAFERTPRDSRKVIIATNLAETSLTINGIVYVLDCGFTKIKAFDSQCGLDCLITKSTSKASAKQRAGRAGRVRAGKAFRLYPKAEYEKLPDYTPPEITRCNPAGVILQLKALGIDNLAKFDFLSRPPLPNLIAGMELLYALGILNDQDGHLTDPIGSTLAEFPLDPTYGKMLYMSGKLGCSMEAAAICAMTQISNVFITVGKSSKGVGSGSVKLQARKEWRRFYTLEGDHLTLLNVYRAFKTYNSSSKWCKQHFLNYKGLCRADELVNRLFSYLNRFKIPIISCQTDSEPILKCLVAGFFCNSAKLHYSGSYHSIRNDRQLQIHPTSVLYWLKESPPEYVVFNEVIHSAQDYMREVSVISRDWLLEMAPHYFDFGTERELLAMAKKRRVE